MNKEDFRFLKDISNWEEVVDDIWYQSKQSWIWNTVQMFKFRKACLNNFIETQDLSFLIYKEGKPIGYFFLLAFKEQAYFEASFLAAPLYWPCFVDAYCNDAQIFKETFSFIDNLSSIYNIGLISMTLTSADSRLYSAIVAHANYIDESYESHIVKPVEFNFEKIRPKYRQMIKKYQIKFSVNIFFDCDITPEIVNQYHLLHVLDSGGNFRDLSTYLNQFQLLQKGGFVVCAYDRENSSAPVGMLHILVSKNRAYDASVAIDPEYHQFYLSHILKNEAIKQLQHQKIQIYELGQSFYCSTFSHIPSKKNYGINYFKDGWSRGETEKIYKSIKFYNKEAFDKFFISKKQQIEDFLELV